MGPKRKFSGHADMNHFRRYMKHKQYPSGATEAEKRNIRKRCQSFTIEDDDRMYFTSTDIHGNKLKKLCLMTTAERLREISKAHITADGTHLGREKMINKIRHSFYWVGVAQSVKDYIKKCRQCQEALAANGYPRPRPEAENTTHENGSVKMNDGSKFSLTVNDEETTEANASLGQTKNDDVLKDVKVEKSEDGENFTFVEMEQALQFWEKVEYRVYGPLKSTDGKEHYIAIFMDQYSRWPETFVIEKPLVASFTQCILKLICRFGTMKEMVQIDCESSLPSKKCLPNATILNKLGISFTNAEYLSNGDSSWDEVTNMLIWFLDQEMAWHEPYVLDLVLLPLRISRPQTAEYSPAFLTYNREPAFPDHLCQNRPREIDYAWDPHLSKVEMQETISKISSLFKECHSNKKHKRTGTNLKQDFVNSIHAIEDLEENDGVENADYYENPDLNEELDIHVTTPEALDKGKKNKGDADDDVCNKRSLRSRRGRKRLKKDEITTDNESDSEFVVSLKKRKKNIKSGTVEDTDLLNSDEKKEEFYSAMIGYLKTETIPSACSKSVEDFVKAQKDNYMLMNGHLCRLLDERKKDECQLTCIVDKKADREALLWSCHTCSINKKHDEHRTGEEMYGDLSKWCDWIGLLDDCEALCKACPNCGTVSVDQPPSPVGNKARSQQALEVLARQAEDHYGALCHYIRIGRFKTGMDSAAKATIQKLSKMFRLEGGDLCLVGGNSTPNRLLLLSKRSRRMVLKEACNKLIAKDGSKLSVKSLYKEVNSKYIWPDLLSDIQKYLELNAAAISEETKTEYIPNSGQSHFSSLFNKSKSEQKAFTAVYKKLKKLHSELSTPAKEEEEEEVPTSEPFQEETAAPTSPQAKSIETTSSNSQTDAAKMSSWRNFFYDVVDQALREAGREEEPSKITMAKETTPKEQEDEACKIAKETNALSKELETIAKTDSGTKESESKVSDSSDISALNENKEKMDDTSDTSALENINETSVDDNYDSIGDNDNDTSGDDDNDASVDDYNTSLVDDNNEKSSSKNQVNVNVMIETPVQPVSESSSKENGLGSAVTSDPVTAAAVQTITECGLEEVTSQQLEDVQEAMEQTKTKETEAITDDSSLSFEEKIAKEIATMTAQIKGKGRCSVYHCKFCKVAVRGVSKYITHLSKHLKKKPYKCDYCDKRFTKTKTKNLHMRKHTGYLPYLCSICGKGFTQKGSLRIHIKIHEAGGNVHVQCSLCGNTFFTQARYERHMKARHFDAPDRFVCLEPECYKKTFTTARSLKRHTDTKHLQRTRYTCQVCGKSFYRKEYMKIHVCHTEKRSKPKVNPSTEESAGLWSTKLVSEDQSCTQTEIETSYPVIVNSTTVESTTVESTMVESTTVESTTAVNTPKPSAGKSQPKKKAVASTSKKKPSSSKKPVETEVTAQPTTLNDTPTISIFSESDNMYYAIQTTDENDQQQVVVYGYPAVQYEVECTTGVVEQIDEEALSAINLLAQASTTQETEGESITFLEQPGF